MNEYDAWVDLLKFYKETFSYPYTITNYLAVRKIILGCCEGLSTHRISKRTKTDYLYVKSVLIDFLGFPGWDVDLDFSPIAIYNNMDVKRNKMAYELFISTNYYYGDKIIIDLSFSLCESFTKLEEMLKQYDN